MAFASEMILELPVTPRFAAVFVGTEKVPVAMFAYDCGDDAIVMARRWGLDQFLSEGVWHIEDIRVPTFLGQDWSLKLVGESE